LLRKNFFYAGNDTQNAAPLERLQVLTEAIDKYINKSQEYVNRKTAFTFWVSGGG